MGHKTEPLTIGTPSHRHVPIFLCAVGGDKSSRRFCEIRFTLYVRAHRGAPHASMMTCPMSMRTCPPVRPRVLALRPRVQRTRPSCFPRRLHLHHLYFATFP